MVNISGAIAPDNEDGVSGLWLLGMRPDVLGCCRGFGIAK
jgi:hypothetical protein